MDLSSLTDENLEGYLVDAEEAVQILGVTQSRLSQLTTKGALGAQRRKIGTRHRLFYRRAELISYMRDQEEGYVVTKRQGATTEPHQIPTKSLERDVNASIPFYAIHPPTLEKRESAKPKVYLKMLASDFSEKERTENLLHDVLQQCRDLLQHSQDLENQVAEMKLALLENRKELHHLKRNIYFRNFSDSKHENKDDVLAPKKVTKSRGSRNLSSFPAVSRRRQS